MKENTNSYAFFISKWVLVILLFVLCFPSYASLSLTKEEQQWIKENPVVKFTGDPNWLPYEAFDEKGNYIGIVAEHLKIISKETGLIFEMSPSKTWTESVNKAKSKEVDVLSETDDSDLKSHLNFTNPYISNPIVIVMRNDENYVEKINNISDKKIALIKNYGYTSKIRKKYSNINFITVDDIQDGLVSVSTGKIDALLCTLALCSYTISELGLNNVKITGKSEFDTKLALGVQKNLPILRSILDKSIEVISRKQQQDILSHWIKNRTVKFIDYTLTVQVIVVSIVILFLLFLWNRRLSHEIELRIKMESESKESRIALEKSEGLLEMAQNLTHIGHWKLNPATGEITGSDELFRIFGSPREEATLETFVEVVHPDDREMDVAAIQRGAEHGESWDIEHRLICRDGTEKWVHAVGEALKDTDGSVVELLGTIQDITKEKLIDIELEETTRRFKAMFESIPDAIVYADPERKISMVNSAAIKMYGYEESELIGNLTKMLYSSKEDFLSQGIKRFNSKGAQHLAPNVVLYQTKQGKEFPGETLGTIVKATNDEVLGYIGIIRDVSEREHADDILRSLASGNANLEFSSFTHDVLTRITKLYHCKYAFIGQLQDDNKNIKTLSVMASGNVVENFEYELAGTPCQDILDTKAELIPRDVCALYPSDKMLVDMGIESYFGAPLIASDGRLLGLLSVMDTKEMELDEWTEPVLGVFAKRVSLELERDLVNEKLKEYQGQLEKQVKIRTIDLIAARNEAERANNAKSEFLSNMSHELRTPMNAILGFSQMLALDEDTLTDIQKSNVNEILDAGEHLLSLINEVLDLAKVESGTLEINIESVDARKVIQECLKLVSSSVRDKKLTVVDKTINQQCFVNADSLRLKQVILNLISNAIKYNEDGGTLTVDVSFKGENLLRLSVTDTGDGLSQDEISKIFVPFERLGVDASIEGAGIGLTITKHLVEEMYGSIGVESSLGEGCTFWIELKGVK